MSGELHDVGSVVNFWPDPGGAMNGITKGVALVVVERSFWVIKTELRRVDWSAASGRFAVACPEGDAPGPALSSDSVPSASIAKE